MRCVSSKAAVSALDAHLIGAGSKVGERCTGAGCPLVRCAQLILHGCGDAGDLSIVLPFCRLIDSGQTGWRCWARWDCQRYCCAGWCAVRVGLVPDVEGAADVVGQGRAALDGCSGKVFCCIDLVAVFHCQRFSGVVDGIASFAAGAAWAV